MEGDGQRPGKGMDVLTASFPSLCSPPSHEVGTGAQVAKYRAKEGLAPHSHILPTSKP